MEKHLLSRKLGWLMGGIIIVSLALFLFTGKEGVPANKETAAADPFYPMNKMITAKYSFPNRPYDTKIFLEGVGWYKGKFTDILKSAIQEANGYSDIPK